MNADGVARLEDGEILTFSDRPFAVTPAETAHLTGPLSVASAKSISFDPGAGQVRGAGEGSDIPLLAGLMSRYAEFARRLVLEIAPAYDGALTLRRTSLRVRPADAAALSARKDDRRLHADTFPSSPTGGARILRVFSNIDPRGRPRVWRIGESFADYAARWPRAARRPWPGEAWLMQCLGATRGRRSPYDALMLRLHDLAKLDAGYQRTAPRREIAFPAGASWIVYTDSVVHAAVAGRWALEQTFTLPVSAMADPGRSPLRVLERMTGRRLA